MLHKIDQVSELFRLNYQIGSFFATWILINFVHLYWASEIQYSYISYITAQNDKPLNIVTL